MERAGGEGVGGGGGEGFTLVPFKPLYPDSNSPNSFQYIYLKN